MQPWQCVFIIVMDYDLEVFDFQGRIWDFFWRREKRIRVTADLIL